jgi:hypothetical protein
MAEGTCDSPLFPRLGTWVENVRIRRCEGCGRMQMKRL